MAAQQTPQRQAAATECPVALERRHGIAGTAGIKTAMGTQPGTEQKTVSAYQLDDEPAHASINCIQSFSRAASSLLPEGPATPTRPSTTMSTEPSRSCQCRKLSRITRLTRLRTTALRATLREIARPRRGWWNGLGVASTVIQRLFNLWRQCLKTRWYSAGLRRRNCCGKRVERAHKGFSNRQSCPALGTTGIDHATTILGTHPGTKAVITLALQVAGLKCSLHGDWLPSSRGARRAGRERAQRLLFSMCQCQQHIGHSGLTKGCG